MIHTDNFLKPINRQLCNNKVDESLPETETITGPRKYKIILRLLIRHYTVTTISPFKKSQPSCFIYNLFINAVITETKVSNVRLTSKI
jgi:hypothetical protein